MAPVTLVLPPLPLGEGWDEGHGGGGAVRLLQRCALTLTLSRGEREPFGEGA